MRCFAVPTTKPFANVTAFLATATPCSSFSRAARTGLRRARWHNEGARIESAQRLTIVPELRQPATPPPTPPESAAATSSAARRRPDRQLGDRVRSLSLARLPE